MGNVSGINNLRYCYDIWIRSLEPILIMRLAYINKASNLGNISVHLALIYENGDGIAKNANKAIYNSIKNLLNKETKMNKII